MGITVLSELLTRYQRGLLPVRDSPLFSAVC